MSGKDIYKDESELVKGIRAGDREAFSYLVSKYQARVKRTCMGFVHSGFDSDDIAQEVFIEVFMSAEKFRHESSLSTWIYRIAVNKSLNFLRSAGRRNFFSLAGGSPGGEKPEFQAVSGNEYCPDAELNKTEHAAALEKAIEKLAPNQQTAFILHKYDDLSYTAIAEIMKTSVPSVESLLFRAKQNLQKSLHHYYKKNLG